MTTADLNKDGDTDILYTGTTDGKTHILLGRGDGSFVAGGSFDGGGPGMFVADLDHDGNPDVVSADFLNNTVSYVLGSGGGTFSSTTKFFAGQSPVAVAVADIASVDADGNVILGTPDGVPDIISDGSGVAQAVFQGPPAIMVAAGQIDSDGKLSYLDPVQLASGDEPIALAIGDVNSDGLTDVVLTDRSGIRIAFTHAVNFPDNSTPATARNLGGVFHVLEPTRRLQHEDAALMMLRRAVKLWRAQQHGPKELELIQQESAFAASLRQRPEFRQILSRDKL